MALSMGQTAGSPYVTLTKTGINGDFTVTRTVAGVTTPVRGTLTVAGGTGVLVDREAPQGTSVQYNAGADSTSGTTLSVGSWLIHPTNSALDTRVYIEKYPTLGYAVPEESLTPLGATEAIVVSGKRQARRATLPLILRNATDEAAVTALLRATRVALLSTNHYALRYAWISMGPEDWEPLAPGPSDVLWRVSIPVTETGRPTVTTSGKVTWLDVAARLVALGQPATIQGASDQWGTWQALLDDAATWNN